MEFKTLLISGLIFSFMIFAMMSCNQLVSNREAREQEFKMSCIHNGGTFMIGYNGTANCINGKNGQ